MVLQVRTLMVTGDNAQTGYYIAKECALVEDHTTVMLAELEAGGR
jgi:magnesium-transporting ATPase (P-type)